MYVLVCIPSLLLSTSEGEDHSFLFKEVNLDWRWAFNFITTEWLIVLPMILCKQGPALLYRIPLTWLQETILHMLLVFSLSSLPRSWDVRWGKLQAWGYIWFSPVSPHFFLFFWMSSHSVSCCLYLTTVFLSCDSSYLNHVTYFSVGSFRQWKSTWQIFWIFLHVPCRTLWRASFQSHRHSSEYLRASVLNTCIWLQCFPISLEDFLNFVWWFSWPESS